MVLDKNHYQTVFKYTKLLKFKTTLALKDIERHAAISMKAKKTLIYKSAFLKPSTNLVKLPILSSKIVYIKVNLEAKSQTLILVAIKAFGLNLISFRILQIIWG